MTVAALLNQQAALDETYQRSFSCNWVTEISGPIMFVGPTSFGAVGDGLTDDFSALQSAINSASSNGEIIITSCKIYMISQCLTVPSATTLEGGAATLRRMSGGDGRVIQSTNAVTLFSNGSPPFNQGSIFVTIRNLICDGNNWSTDFDTYPRSSELQTDAALNSELCNVINWWGSNLFFDNVRAVKAKANAWRINFANNNEPRAFADPALINCSAELANRRCFWFQGPSDISTFNLTGVDGGQEIDDSFDLWQIDTRSNGRHYHAHVFHRGVGPNRARNALNSAGEGNNELFGCHFEGARKLYFQNQGNSGDKFIGCLLYAPFSAGPVIVLESGGCIFDATTQVKNDTAQPNAIAFQLGSAASVHVGSTINCEVYRYDGGVFLFTNNAGLSRMSGKSFSSGPLWASGTVPASGDTGLWDHGGPSATVWCKVASTIPSSPTGRSFEIYRNGSTLSLS